MTVIKRLLQKKIVERLVPGKAVLIFGTRRVGKTVLMRQIIDSYAGNIMLLNGEDNDALALLAEKSIANYSRLVKGIDLLAIDEAQNVPDIGAKLKLMLDEIRGLRVLASGSSSFELFSVCP
jgi:predicted AAA+ superfamily ATPase